MHIIINKQLVTVKKIKERKHWLWGTRWLVEYATDIYDRHGNILYTKTECEWVKPSKIICDDTIKALQDNK